MIGVALGSWPFYAMWLPGLAIFTFLALFPTGLSILLNYFHTSQGYVAIFFFIVIGVILYSGRRLHDLILSSILTETENRKLLQKLARERNAAEAARRTYPASPLPADAQPLFAEMQAFLDNVADQVVSMLTDRDTKTAEQIILNDDKLDALHKKTFELAQSEDWKGTNQQLIDVVLIGRFMERLGDHAVSAARRVMFIVSGFDPSKEPTRDEGTDID